MHQQVGICGWRMQGASVWKELWTDEGARTRMVKIISHSYGQAESVKVAERFYDAGGMREPLHIGILGAPSVKKSVLARACDLHWFIIGWPRDHASTDQHPSERSVRSDCAEAYGRFPTRDESLAVRTCHDQHVGVVISLAMGGGGRERAAPMLWILHLEGAITWKPPTSEQIVKPEWSGEQCSNTWSSGCTYMMSVRFVQHRRKDWRKDLEAEHDGSPRRPAWRRRRGAGKVSLTSGATRGAEQGTAGGAHERVRTSRHHHRRRMSWRSDLIWRLPFLVSCRATSWLLHVPTLL